MNRIFGANLGRNRANRLGTVGVALINSGGSVTTARSTTSVFQAGSGFYFKTIAIPSVWSGIILWDDGGTVARLYAAQIHDSKDQLIEMGIGSLINRIPGSIKRDITGTFSYSLIAQIGTHLNARITGSVKLNNAGTFNYANIALIPGLGTHLQSRVTGTVADASALGTHLNSRITGTVKRSNTGTFSYVSAAAGSSPSYIGSAVWSKNPNNFIASDTFGQRIGKILERASSGVGGVAVASQVFNEKEKKLLFDWIKVMLDRIMTIEVTIGQLNPETKKIISEVFVNIKTNQTKLEEALQQFLKLDAKQKEGIKNDINFIATSFEEITKLDSNVKMIRDNLSRMEKELQFSIKEIPVGKLSSTITLQSQELKTLLNQSINVANDVSSRLARNLTILAEDRKSLTLTEKAILKLLPTEKLKDILDTDE